MGDKEIAHNATIDAYVERIAVLERSERRLVVALESLVSLPLRYNDNRIEIDCASHGDAMLKVRVARDALKQAKG